MNNPLHGNITIKTHSLKYTIYPGGSRTLVCFHGFGQDHSAYKSVYEAVKGTHSVYSFDLPFHGRSSFEELKEPLKPEDWKLFMVEFFKKEGISSFEVMGFSMGGKYAMVTTELFPEMVSHMHLAAPDGIGTHFSYKLSTHSHLVRGIFKSQIEKPWLFNALVKIARSLRLMNSYTLRFAESQMNTVEKRAQVYRTWVFLRQFFPDLGQLAQAIKAYSIKTTFYLGNHDRVIDRATVQPLIDLIPDCEVKVLESGHTQLLKAVAESLSPA